uniref:Uncharacterized protein n=1 Tax=Amphora coffeiformis TaxID=265554 RepID=A0A7S3LBE2_9STRA|mmetsp:Transcript_15160/g.28754  ORF Transcript_15160/g.28754 Transcript_15160/m.28754 type:complete len:243 (+) Transcript_15160:139-867(+)
MKFESPGRSLTILTLLSCLGWATSFMLTSSKSLWRRPRTYRSGSSFADEGGSFTELLFLERFRRKKSEMELLVKNELNRRPPNVALSPEETVAEILQGLRRPHHPIRYFGLAGLLRASTFEWRTFLCASVAAPAQEDDETVAAALEAAMSRPNNQFRILLGLEDTCYLIDFPTDPVDYQDGSCWLECRLRSKDTNDLLVALGWSLKRDTVSEAWVVDGLDWQDFREKYRPGIGREEWERICG